jgi:DNA repair exonuclease SbcCD ATPase subunit
MKIVFKRVRVKNFLSFGNNETIFDYKTGINVVTSIIDGTTKKNGGGKSALLVDSISFALYGRPLRGDAHINKEDLINDVNQRDCSVSVDFNIDKEEYTVTRTIKPNGLTIIHNGQEVKFDSMKNTQEWLINKIGISHTCFSNILVLNVNSSQPFLGMDASLKREVIEDVLSLNIYGRMSDHAKTIHLSSKGDKSILETEWKSALKQLDLANESMKSIQSKRDSFEEDKKINCDNIRKEIETLQDKINSVKIDDTDYSSTISSLKESINNIDSKILVLIKKETECKKELRDATDVLKKLEHEIHCPTCKTVLSDSPIAQKFLQECRDKIKSSEEMLKDIVSKKEVGKKAKDTKNSQILEIEDKISKSEQIKNQVKLYESQLNSKRKELEREMSRTLDLDSIISEEKHKEYKDAVVNSEMKMNESIETFEYTKLIRNMLGEDGVRKFVLSKIIPFFNTKINHYLKIMGSDYSLIFDNNLVEKVITRNRETRNYNNFSSGEKKRIDLSILLALMDIAKAQNSVDTNILVLDEVLDTSMDNEGVENFLFFLKNGFRQMYQDKCIYIITHRSDISADNFDRLVKLKKVKNFSIIDSIVEMQP